MDLAIIKFIWVGMNSLRTDDILGAKPRVRHMPKDLIRDRRNLNPYYPSPNYQNPEWNHLVEHPQYPPNERFAPIEYQNNDPKGIPFLPQNRLNKEAKYVNYDFSKPSNQLGSRYEEPRLSPPQLMRAASELRNAADSQSSNRTKPLNYNEHVEQRARINRSMQAGSRGDQESERRSQVRSSRSGAIEAQNDEGKRIFRGLGFNIISNHKYEYLYEQRVPHPF